jgi:signal transduction histidine kinase
MRLAMEAGPLGTWTYDIDTREAEMSDFCYEVFGLPKPYQGWDLPKATSMLFDEDRDRVLSILRHGIATQTDVEYEARVRRPDGTWRWYWVKGRHVKKEGRLNRLVGVLADITERKLNQEALEKARRIAELRANELDSLYRTAPIGLAMFDPVDFRFLNLNDRQAEMIGLPKHEIVGKTIRELTPGVEANLMYFRQAAAGLPVMNALVEGSLPGAPEEQRSWAVNYMPMFGADGEVQAITTASMEVTAQKRAEAALLQSEKIAAVGRLASSISHEINNPLEAVMNLLYLARNGAKNSGQTSEMSEEVFRYLDLADGELRRVAAIVSQTLRFYRQATNPTETNCAELLSGVLELYRGRLANAEITVEKRKLAMHPVLCFEGEVRQVVSNLVANALDAMPQGGRLLVRSRDTTDWRTGHPGLAITVADTGTGMGRETQARVFEAFFSTKGIGGTGLGLWLSMELVRKHYGSLRVRSQLADPENGIAGGTVFRLFLPRNPPREIPVAGD